ncbi:MAG: hypothetical protein NZ561_02975 [Phycisphaerae bacterium]|nr:hypothetical protein [Phycisphaerae bacterium]MDW8260892.1 kelch repeat-containing protein [Phycisphaerales bacterium]
MRACAVPYLESLEPRRLLCDGHVDAVLPQGITTLAASPPSLSWGAVNQVPQPREEGAAAVVGSKLYLFGGFFNSDFEATTRVDVLDTATGRWSQAAPMLLPTTHSPVVQTASRVFFFGGYVGTDPGPATAAIQIYNFRTNKWTRGVDMPAPRGAHAAVLVGNLVYLFGGRNKARTAEFQETWSFNLDTNEFRTIARMPDPRNHLTGAQVDGQVYAIGGQKKEAAESSNLNVVHRYNPKKNRWFPAANLPVAVSHQLASTFVYQKKIIVVGGETAHNVAAREVRVFDPYENRWSQLTPLPEVRRAGFGGLIDDRMYLASGSVVGASQREVFRSSRLEGIL